VVGEDGSGRERATGAGDEHQLSRQTASPFGLRVLAAPTPTASWRVSLLIGALPSSTLLLARPGHKSAPSKSACSRGSADFQPVTKETNANAEMARETRSCTATFFGMSVAFTSPPNAAVQRPRAAVRDLALYPSRSAATAC
jgi:hypothetical protein